MQSGELLTNFAPVDFELSFAGAAGADHAARATAGRAAGHARQMRPLPRQPRCEVTELRDLDLQLALQRARALRENIEDELAAIDDAKVEFLFEVAGLRGAERIIENRERSASAVRDLFHLGGLALADKRARVRRLELLRDGLGDFGAGGLGEGLSSASDSSVGISSRDPSSIPTRTARSTCLSD